MVNFKKFSFVWLFAFFSSKTMGSCNEATKNSRTIEIGTKGTSEQVKTSNQPKTKESA